MIVLCTGMEYIAYTTIYRLTMMMVAPRDIETGLAVGATVTPFSCESADVGCGASQQMTSTSR